MQDVIVHFLASQNDRGRAGLTGNADKPLVLGGNGGPVRKGGYAKDRQVEQEQESQSTHLLPPSRRRGGHGDNFKYNATVFW